MKISELISVLEAQKEEIGDAEVMLKVDDVLEDCEDFVIQKNVEIHRAEKAGGDYTIPVVLLLMSAYDKLRETAGS